MRKDDEMNWRRIRNLALVFGPRVRRLCRMPYPGHPRGCPNYGKRPACPPTAPAISATLDLGYPVYAIWNAFDLASHAKRMRRRHPNWSERQVYCCLYWQPRARKQLRQHIAEFLRAHKGLHIIKTPEAQGVNVTETMRCIGLELEWPPRQIAYQVAIAGNPT